MASYDGWKQDVDYDAHRGPRETRDTTCIKCGTPMTVPFGYLGQPWCYACVEKDKQVAKHYRPNARTA